MASHEPGEMAAGKYSRQMEHLRVVQKFQGGNKIQVA